jgi:hypothetical protein
LQRRLLETEGIAINGKRVNMKEFAWVPKKTRTRSKARVRGSVQGRKKAR